MNDVRRSSLQSAQKLRQVEQRGLCEQINSHESGSSPHTQKLYSNRRKILRRHNVMTTGKLKKSLHQNNCETATSDL